MLTNSSTASNLSSMDSGWHSGQHTHRLSNRLPADTRSSLAAFASHGGCHYRSGARWYCESEERSQPDQNAGYAWLDLKLGVSTQPNISKSNSDTVKTRVEQCVEKNIWVQFRRSDTNENEIKVINEKNDFRIQQYPQENINKIDQRTQLSGNFIS